MCAVKIGRPEGFRKAEVSEWGSRVVARECRQPFYHLVIPALEAGTFVRMWRFVLIKVPGSPPGNDEF